MQQVGVMQQQVAEMLAEAGGGVAFPGVVDPSKISKLCKSLLEVSLFVPCGSLVSKHERS